MINELGTVPWETHQLLSMATRLVERRWDQLLAPLGLTHATALTLKAIAAGGPLNQEHLAGMLRSQAQTVGRILSGLDRTGLVRRTRNPDDLRSFDIHLTDAGRGALSAACRAEEDLFPSPMSENPDLDRELARVLYILSTDTDNPPRWRNSLQ